MRADLVPHFSVYVTHYPVTPKINSTFFAVIVMPSEVSGAHLHVLNTAIYSFTLFYALNMNVAFLQRQENT